MSQFNGRKCDICGKEDRNEVHDLETTLNQSCEVAANEASTPRQKPWARVWWTHNQDFCPSCAVVINSAIRFARNILSNRE